MNYSLTKTNYNFIVYSLSTVFLGAIYKQCYQSIFYNEIKRGKHSRIPDEKRKFLKNLGFPFKAKVLNEFRGSITSIKIVKDSGCEKGHQPHQKYW